MPSGNPPHRARVAALLLGATLTLGMAAPAAAQDAPASTPDADTSSEIASQLPPADLPTMNPQGFVFELQSTFSGSLSGIPQEAPVYAMSYQTYDADQTRQVAERFGVSGDPEEQGEGTFSISGDGGSVFVTPGLVQFISSESVPEGDLPGDDEAIAFAREYLRQVGTLPANVGNGRIELRSETPARIIVSFQPVQPMPILSATPNITVTLGPQGAILETSMRWATLSEGDLYQLRGSDAAWAEVEGKRSYLEVELPGDLFEAGSTITGNAEYTEVSLAYTSSGIPGEAQYLQPVYVFTGTISPEGTDDAYPISAYVPALVNSRQPVG